MDKRTIEGRKFNELKNSEEKMLFLLEGIYDRSESWYNRSQLYKIEKNLKFLIELNIHQLQLQNKTRIWTDDYIKELKQRLRHL